MTDAYETTEVDALPAELPSGETFYVLTENEAEFVAKSTDEYLSHNAFQNISDLRDIDNIVAKELLIHRWQLWVSRQIDYFNQAIDTEDYTKRVKDISNEVRQLKKQVGLDKKTRDQATGDDSFPVWLEQAKKRARKFGQLRDEQRAEVITAFQELNGFLQFHDNCDEREQREQGCTQDDVIVKLREQIAKFEEIDAKFLEDEQQHWGDT